MKSYLSKCAICGKENTKGFLKIYYSKRLYVAFGILSFNTNFIKRKKICFDCSLEKGLLTKDEYDKVNK